MSDLSHENLNKSTQSVVELLKECGIEDFEHLFKNTYGKGHEYRFVVKEGKSPFELCLFQTRPQLSNGKVIRVLNNLKLVLIKDLKNSFFFYMEGHNHTVGSIDIALPKGSVDSNFDDEYTFCLYKRWLTYCVDNHLNFREAWKTTAISNERIDMFKALINDSGFDITNYTGRSTSKNYKTYNCMKLGFKVTFYNWGLKFYQGDQSQGIYHLLSLPEEFQNYELYTEMLNFIIKDCISSRY